MKVILIVLMLLIPAWCYADGNELLKRCSLLVEYTDSESPDISLSGEMMFCAGFMQGITNMNLLYQQGSQIGCTILSSRMGNFK